MRSTGTATILELRRAEAVFVDVQLPAVKRETVGVLLLDPASDKLYMKFRIDWDEFAPTESDVLSLLAEDLAEKAREMGGQRVLQYLEEHWSNTIQVSEREIMQVADFEARLRRLFRENVLIPVVPYRTHLPLTSCEAAAGGLGRQLGLDEIRSWIAIPASVHPGTGMFVAKVQGRSMEPLIADGSLCVFRSNVTGSRSGRRLLIEKLGEFDEAARFTIKIYHSEKKQLAEDEWAHSTIRLEPLNPEFSAWELAPDEFRVVGELVSVLDAEE